MPNYRYKARYKETHKRVGGLVDAKDEKEAVQKLRAKNLLILSISLDHTVALSLPFLNRVNNKERVLFARELAVMVKAGLPILQALRAIADQTPHGSFKKTLTSVIVEIEGGTALSEAFSHYPAVFPPLFVSVTRSGEKSGELEQVLERLANQLEKDDDLRTKVRGAMIYPAFVLISLLSVVILIMVYIIPQLKGLFDEVNIELPLVTRVMLTLSNLVSHYIAIWLVIAVVVVLGLKIAMRQQQVRYRFERLYFLIPVFGKLHRRVLMARFTHTLATMLAAGIPMIEAIKTTGQVVNSPTYNQSLIAVTSQIKEGQTLSHSLLADREFPPMIGHMLAIGESSGTIDTVLETVAGFFDKEIENLTRNLSSLLEPILMVLMGLGVGLVVASVIVPIYNLVNAV